MKGLFAQRRRIDGYHLPARRAGRIKVEWRRFPAFSTGLWLFFFTAFLCGRITDATESSSSAQTFSSVRPIIVQAIQQRRFPSIIIGLLHGARTYWFADGYSDVERHIRPTSQTIYAVGSLTKAFTASVVLMERRNHRIDVNASIDRYLPKPLPKFDLSRRITVQDALDMRAGIPHMWWYAPAPVRASTLAAVFDRFGFSPYAEQAGFIYSNLSYGVVGRVLEYESRETFAAVVTRDLFAPLGMSDSTIGAPKPSARTAVAYHLGNERLATLYNIVPEPAANGYSSVHDLLRFAAFMLKAPELHSLGFTDRGGHQFRYSDGWLILGAPSNDTLIGNGEVESGGASLILLPKENTAVVVLSNRGSDSDDLIDQLAVSVADQYQPGLKHLWNQVLNSSDSGPSATPGPIVGTWSGTLYRGRSTVGIAISPGQCAIGSSTGELVNIRAQASEVFATCRAHMRFPELRTHPYELTFDLRNDGGDLTGVLFATSTDAAPGFKLPYPVTLSRRDR